MAGFGGVGSEPAQASEGKWTLVVVTNDGNVSSSRHASQYEAEQAKCIAMHGMTLQEKSEHDERQRIEIQRWFKEHPNETCFVSGVHSSNIRYAQCFPSRPDREG